MSYVGLFVQITDCHDTSWTPAGLLEHVRKLLADELADDETDVGVSIDEHSGECSPETCGSESGGHDQHALP